MKQEITKVLADGAAASAVSLGAATKLGWFDFINANAPGLGVIASCIFGVIATIFYYLTYAKSTQADENKIKLDEHIQSTEESFSKVDDGINEILNKLNNTQGK